MASSLKLISISSSNTPSRILNLERSAEKHYSSLSGINPQIVSAFARTPFIAIDKTCAGDVNY